MAAEILGILHHFMVKATDQVKFYRHVNRIDNLGGDYRDVLGCINDLYEMFPEKENITENELLLYMQHKWPSRNLDHLTDIVNSAMKTDIGSEVTRTLIEGLIEQHMAAKIAVIVGPIISNQASGTLYKANEVLNEYAELCSMAEKSDQLQDCDMSFADAMTYVVNTTGYQWHLDILNKCLGGVRPGLGLVIARPDTGKTSFLLNAFAYWAHQLKLEGSDRQLLYCNNEEGIVGIKARFGVSLLGVQTAWAEENPVEFNKRVMAANGGCVRFHGGVRSTRDVEVLVKRYNPVVVVADQIAKFKIPGAKTEGPAGLAEIYSWFRELGNKEELMVIGVAQADAKSGQWITMDNINASKTDVPGELDWGVGIGLVDEPGLEQKRFINIFKIKNGRKGRAAVKFLADRCRFLDK